jgi:hypothetical protein
LEFEISNLKSAGRGVPAGGEAGSDCGAGEMDGAEGPGGGAQGEIENRARAGGGAWSGLKDGVEEPHVQGLGLELDLDLEEKGKRVLVGGGGAADRRGIGGIDLPGLFSGLDSKTTSSAESNAKALLDINSKSNTDSNSNSNSNARQGSNAEERGRASGNSAATCRENEIRKGVRHTSGFENGIDEFAAKINRLAGLPPQKCARCQGEIGQQDLEDADAGLAGRGRAAGAPRVAAYAGSGHSFRDKKEELLQRELRVGRGPSSYMEFRVKPAALERNRLRDLKRNGTRSP